MHNFAEGAFFHHHPRAKKKGMKRVFEKRKSRKGWKIWVILSPTTKIFRPSKSRYGEINSTRHFSVVWTGNGGFFFCGEVWKTRIYTCVCEWVEKLQSYNYWLCWCRIISFFREKKNFSFWYKNWKVLRKWIWCMCTLHLI